MLFLFQETRLSKMYIFVKCAFVKSGMLRLLKAAFTWMFGVPGVQVLPEVLGEVKLQPDISVAACCLFKGTEGSWVCL